MSTAVILSLLFLTVPSLAADLRKIPARFCESARSVSATATTCADNRLIAEGAEACVARLNKLEAELGITAHEIARSGQKSQLSQVSTGTSEYGFSAQALSYLMGVTRVAATELKGYPEYLAPPDGLFNPEVSGNDPLRWADATACQGGNERRIEEAQKTLSRKLAMYEARRKESNLYSRKLKESASDFGSLTDAPVVSGSRPADQPKLLKKPGRKTSSRITGIELDKRKRLKKD